MTDRPSLRRRRLRRHRLQSRAAGNSHACSNPVERPLRLPRPRRLRAANSPRCSRAGSRPSHRSRRRLRRRNRNSRRVRQPGRSSSARRRASSLGCSRLRRVEPHRLRRRKHSVPSRRHRRCRRLPRQEVESRAPASLRRCSSREAPEWARPLRGRRLRHPAASLARESSPSFSTTRWQAAGDQCLALRRRSRCRRPPTSRWRPRDPNPPMISKNSLEASMRRHGRVHKPRLRRGPRPERVGD